MEIRSYRAVFDLERRIYRVDRLRLNPAGVPVRGVAYFLVVLLVASILSVAPVAGSVVGSVPWYLREIAAPGALSALLTVVRIEGRPFHLAASALIRFGCSSRLLCGPGLRPSGARCWRPGDLLCLPDGSEPRMRRLRYVGAGAVRVSAAHRLTEWPRGPLSRLLRLPQVTIEQLPAMSLASAKLIELGSGARLEVR